MSCTCASDMPSWRGYSLYARTAPTCPQLRSTSPTAAIRADRPLASLTTVPETSCVMYEVCKKNVRSCEADNSCPLGTIRSQKKNTNYRELDSKSFMLLTPGLGRTLGVMYDHTLSLCLQVTKSDITLTGH